MANDNAPKGPDFAQGIPSSDLAEGKMLAGRVGDEEVLLARQGGRVFAVGAQCTHYHGPLVEGLLVNGTVRCPWHQACFDLATGEALEAPALSPLPCYAVTEKNGRIIVTDKTECPTPKKTNGKPQRVVIVGGGAAGFACAEMMRRRGFGGSITMLSNDEAAPVDRPNLSKDYLAGNAPEAWVPLREDGWYAGNLIDLKLKTEVSALDARGKTLTLADGSTMPFDKLLLATGAEPVKLEVPGAQAKHVHTLRSLADSRGIIEAAKNAKRAVVIGASFIGLEVAASLRAREIEVTVLAPDKRPLERVFGPQIADFVRKLHEEYGVKFALETGVKEIDTDKVLPQRGPPIPCDFVVVGVGVRPRLALAEKAGLKIDKGVSVDRYLQTSAPDIFAAGDIARWPDAITGQNIRVEHWVVAERQGQCVAMNMMGEQTPFTAVPFFWSQHYDVPINYVGHAEGWDTIEIDGDPMQRDCTVRYLRDGKAMAVATIYRDGDSLKAAEQMAERAAKPFVPA